ncbi:TIP41-like protein isoform X4 [Myotis myotis]|uniref:TIP41-like protein isoform X4 n=1 Tax=Myotis myotis TaxID=51298 RepID=UPI00174B7A55|nr:TIP41-like protein isoform X4 [Myotis myotis]
MVTARKPRGPGRRGGETGVRCRRSCPLRAAPAAAMMIHGFQSSHRDFSFGPWTLTATKTHIMKSADVEKLADELHMPSLPEMMFGDNVLRIQHGSGFGIEFNATDALRCVNNYQGMLKVACAEEWQESRNEGEHSKEVIKPYDWTFTTDYKGTLLGESLKLKVVPTTDHIDTEKLKAREQIKFFEEVLLFEDELHDHGVSSLSVKICGETEQTARWILCKKMTMCQDSVPHKLHSASSIQVKTGMTSISSLEDGLLPLPMPLVKHA